MAGLPVSPPLTPTKRKISSTPSAGYLSPPSNALASTSMSSPSPSPGGPTQGPAKLPPLPADIALPPLPPIADKELERLAFTHSSWSGKQKDRHGLDLTVEIVDNEKLEHVGDSLLGCIVTLLLHQLYPNLGDGTATVLKAHLVSNATLAQISSRYGLHKRFIASPASMFSIQTGEKSRANLFEAYIAALYASLVKECQAQMATPPLTPLEEPSSASNGSSRDMVGMDDAMAFMTISVWLRGVFTPIAGWAFEQMKEQRTASRRQGGQPGEEDDGAVDDKAMGRTAQLNEFFTRYHGKIPRYEYSPSAESGMWTCVCTATEREGGSFTASATRGNKKIAAQVAAWKICSQLGWE